MSRRIKIYVGVWLGTTAAFVLGVLAERVLG